jgi:hypothetical protein
MRYTGYLVVDGYAGRTVTAVEIIGETRTKYRVRAIQRTKLAGRNRWLESGAAALVPKRAIVAAGGKPFTFEVHP